MKVFGTSCYTRTVAAGLALLALSYSARAAEAPNALAPEAKYLPDNCQMVGVVRVAQLLGSPAYQQFKKASPQCAKQEATIAGNMPLPLDQIDRIVFGGGVTGGGEDEGLWVVHARTKIDPEHVIWAKTRFDLPAKEKVGKYEVHTRRTESYCIVGDDLLVFGRLNLLRAVLERDKAPTFSSALDAALKDTDLTATVAFTLDVTAIRSKRRGETLPFIPGLQMVRAEAATNGLALMAKFGEQIEVSATALAATDAGATTLKQEAGHFADFQSKVLKEDRNAPDDVLDIFKFNVTAEGKRVTVSTKFGAASAATLLKLLVQ